MSDAHGLQTYSERMLEGADAEAWPELVPLDGPVSEPFPTDALPEPLRSWVLAEAETTQTPAILPALISLAVCAAAIAKRVRVRPLANDWTEPTNLFVAVLLDPANRKSAVFQDATKPLRELEAELIERERPSVKRAESELRMLNAELKKLEDSAAKGAADARDAALALAERIDKIPVPALPRLIVDDATPEKIEMILAQQGGRLASMSPEGGVFDLMAGRYSERMPSFDVYLKGHNGDDLRTDRVKRESVFVEAPALTAAYAIQPEVLRGLAGKPAFRGRGLVGRFLWALPTSTIGRRKIRPAPMPAQVREAYRLRVRDLMEISGEHVLTLEPDADAAFDRWATEAEDLIGDGGDLEPYRDWGGKLSGATARLAAIFHMVERGPAGLRQDIQLATVEGAETIARSLIPHAEAAIRLLAASGPVDAGACRVARWIRRKNAQTFTANEAWQGVRKSFRQREDLDAVFEALEDRGYIRRVDAPNRGPGRPSERYETNPLVVREDAGVGTGNTENAA